MRIDVVTLFPEAIRPYLAQSILGIAQEKGLVRVVLHNLRDFTLDRHGKVDDRPYGGGPGMVLTPEPVFRAIEHVRTVAPDSASLILLSPEGVPFHQGIARELAREEGLILIAGHYEGFDERIRLGLSAREISLGPFILTGGEIPALAIIDAVARLVHGVVGDPDSVVRESFSEGDLLDFPQYTRPRDFRGMQVPDVLLSGDHQKIAEWRGREAEARTRARRNRLEST